MSMLNRRTALALLGGAALCSVCPGGAFAHRVPITLTEISWSENTHSLQIIHELHVHDAEEGLARVRNERGIMLVDLEARAKLAIYVEEHFTLQDGEGNIIPLTLIGAEVEGDHALVYQEAKLEALPKDLLIGCSILRGVIPGQSNQVNIRIKDSVQTLVFKGDDTLKAANLLDNPGH